MEGITLLTFPVQNKFTDPFRLYVKDIEEIEQPVWDVNASSLLLSQTLSQQSYYSLFNLHFLLALCEDKEEAYTVESGGENFRVRNYRVADQSRPCAKLQTAFNSFIDVFARDEDVFRPKVTYNVQIYATVLLLDGDYYGHIYSWISPTDKDVCVFIGIRSRVDAFFIREETGKGPSVASLLLEGVRRFALSFSCKQMVVLRPLKVMRTLLPSFGFVREDRISGRIIGKSISNHREEDCRDCMTRDTTEPINQDVQTFILKTI